MNTYKNKLQLNYTNIISSIINALYVIIILIAILYLLFNQIYSIRKVEENSMQPLLNPSGNNTDIVYVNRYDKDITYGDIVVINLEKSIIKRVVGLPGDTIDIKYNENTERYMLYRNGEFVVEDYIKIDASNLDTDGMYTTHINFTRYKENNADKLSLVNGILCYKVPQDSIFVLGDNRRVSQDSSEEGAYSMSKLMGTVKYIQSEGESNLDIMTHYIFTFEWMESIATLFN